MEDKIEIGEYVRDKQGRIFRYLIKEYGGYITDTVYNSDKHKEYRGRYDHGIKDYLLYLTEEQINECKHSHNLIKIIEDGDIVNGMMVEKFDDELGFPIYTDSLMDCIEEIRPLDTIKIKTILTHEQYEANCYRLEE
jgi:hypothetical protein